MAMPLPEPADSPEGKCGLTTLSPQIPNPRRGPAMDSNCRPYNFDYIWLGWTPPLRQSTVAAPAVRWQDGPPEPASASPAELLQSSGHLSEGNLYRKRAALTRLALNLN